MHDDAPMQIPGDVAALLARAIEGEEQVRCRVQPVQLAGDPIAGLVEMANRGLGHALADGLVDRTQLSRLLVHPSDDAGRTDRRGGEQIAQGLRDAILGDQLLDIEIDSRRPDALAVFCRRDDALGKSSLRHVSAMRATVNRGLMFGDHERALRECRKPAASRFPLADRASSDLNRNNRRRRPRVEPRRRNAVTLPQSAACVARLAAARLAGTDREDFPRREGFFPSPSLEGGLEPIPNCSNPIGDPKIRPPPPEAPLSPPSLQRSYQVRDLRGDNHPYDSRFVPPCPPKPPKPTKFANTTWPFRTHPASC